MINAANQKDYVSPLRRYRLNRVVKIAIFWTLADFLYNVLSYRGLEDHTAVSLIVRSMLIFFISLFLAYMFAFTFRRILRDAALSVNFVLKSIIVLISALLLNGFVSAVEYYVIHGISLNESFQTFLREVFETKSLVQRTVFWLTLFGVTQLFLEITDKYAPGVFIDILAGKYINPKEERRIVMFLDLKDSTPIAEKLGHENYFLFIREFIKLVAEAVSMHEGIIYQYVGDEIVVSWLYNEANIKKPLASIITARKRIQQKSEWFRRHFEMVPEFRVGIHVGLVTIGEIGVIKKDLAMSGDTMNTTARIRSACNELNQKFIVSKAYKDIANLTDWQLQSLGIIDLKGKSEGIELFSLKV